MPSSSASTRSSTPSSTAGAIIIRASCPPPTTPTRSAMNVPSVALCPPIIAQALSPCSTRWIRRGRRGGHRRDRLRVAVSEDLVDLDLVDERLVHERDARDVRHPQRLIDPVGQRERSGAPHPLDEPRRSCTV